MTRTKLQRLKRRLAMLRQRAANIHSAELQSLARALGHVRDTSRGKEPTFVSLLLPNSRPLSIPDNPGSLKRFTAGNILDVLEQDSFALEAMLADK